MPSTISPRHRTIASGLGEGLDSQVRDPSSKQESSVVHALRPANLTDSFLQSGTSVYTSLELPRAINWVCPKRKPHHTRFDCADTEALSVQPSIFLLSEDQDCVVMCQYQTRSPLDACLGPA
jgi:hypothetical protein